MILFLIFKILGYENASNLGSKIGILFGKLIKSDKIIKKNVNIIRENSNYREDIKKIINDVFSNYGRILSEYIYLSKFKKGSLNKYVKINGSKYLEDIKTNNKKVVFISGHFNNFELMAMFIDAAGINLSAIYRPLNNIFLNKIMEKIRIKHICKNQIKKGKSGSRELIKFLNKNYSVALMIDQRVSEGIPSKLFNQVALTTTIPAQIVKKFNIPVVPVYIQRIQDINFKITIGNPINFSKDTSVKKITDELNIILEKMIMKKPEQWIWSHNRWK